MKILFEISYTQYILAENSDYADRYPYCSYRFLWFVKD